jgi:hypothetical protein
MEKTELIGIEPIQDLVELALWTAYVKYEKIASLMIVAEYESGKTELLKKYRRNNGVHGMRRFSAVGVQNDLIQGRINTLFDRPKILGHLIVYDFATIYSFKANTVDSTIAFLDALTEEGLEPESTYAINCDAIKNYSGLRGGIIAAINTEGFFTLKSKRRIRANLKKGGFFSRNIIVSYAISESQIRGIFDEIIDGQYRANEKYVNLIAIDFPGKRIDVRISRRRAEELEKTVYDIREDLADDLGHTVKGIRLFKSLISLTKASALRDGRIEVNSEDVERIQYLSNWMNLRMNRLRSNNPFPW